MEVPRGRSDAHSLTLGQIGSTPGATRETHASAKAYSAKKAIAEFLDKQEDYLIAVSRLEDNLPSILLDEVVRQLGLDDPVRTARSERP
jgi:hypothetical protein